MASRRLLTSITTTRPLVARRWASAGATTGQAAAPPQASGKGDQTLKIGARRDPELYVRDDLSKPCYVY